MGRSERVLATHGSGSTPRPSPADIARLRTPLSQPTVSGRWRESRLDAPEEEQKLRLRPQFSILTLLVVVTCFSLLMTLNTRETTTIAEPQYAPLWGATPHPPPYDMKEMAIPVYKDRGWPIWHSRASKYFAAHNAALYIDGPWGMGEFLPETDYTRLAIDACAGSFILIAVGVGSELLFRRLRWVHRPTRHNRTAESPNNPQPQSGTPLGGADRGKMVN